MYNKIAILGVVYPGVEEYLSDYFNSLDNQTIKDFDLWIYNDGVSTKYLEEITQDYSICIKTYNIMERISPAKIREIAIKNLRDKYNYLIFTDTDDFISEDRIEKNILALQNYDFCYNNMFLTDLKGNKLSDSDYYSNKNNPLIVNKFEDIIDKNFCGLSNTAVNLNNIDFSLLNIPDNIIAVDWWIFSNLVLNDFKGVFVSDTYTFYRQHESNTVGGLKEVSINQIRKGINVKKIHFSELLKSRNFKYKDLINVKLSELTSLEGKILDKNYQDKILKYFNNTNHGFLWWENIKLIG